MADHSLGCARTGGPFEIDGIDGILLENDLVKGNVVRYESATFDALVATAATCVKASGLRPWRTGWRRMVRG
jgi:hypothetical protein